MLTVGTFADQDSATPATGPRNANVLGYEEYGFAYDLGGNHPLEQAYDYVRALPDFAGAVDVLETTSAPMAPAASEVVPGCK